MTYKNIQNLNFDYKQISTSTVVCIEYYIHDIQEHTRTSTVVCVCVSVSVCVCVYVCVSLCVCVCMCLCLCLCMCVCLYVSMCVCVFVYVCMSMFVCVCVYLCICVCVCVYVSLCVCVWLCVCVCVCGGSFECSKGSSYSKHHQPHDALLYWRDTKPMRPEQALSLICSSMNSPSLEDTTILPSIMQLPRDNTQILKS